MARDRFINMMLEESCKCVCVCVLVFVCFTIQHSACMRFCAHTRKIYITMPYYFLRHLCFCGLCLCVREKNKTLNFIDRPFFFLSSSSSSSLLLLLPLLMMESS